MYARAGRRPLRSEKLCTRTGNDMLLSTDPIDPQNQDVYALWDQLADFSVADGDAALTHLMSALRTMLSARNVLWGVVVRLPSPKRADPLLGWRPRLVRVLDPIPAVGGFLPKQDEKPWSHDGELSPILLNSGGGPVPVRPPFGKL